MTSLEQERKRRGWSRQRLAAELARLMKETDTRYPISTAQIGRWERGESRPTDYWIEKLCALYEMTAEELGLYRAPDGDAPIARWTAPTRSPDPFVQTADVARTAGESDAAEGASAPMRVANDQAQAQTQAAPHRAVSASHEHDRHDRPRGHGMRGRLPIHRQWEERLASPARGDRRSRFACWRCWFVLAALIGLFATYLFLTLAPFLPWRLALSPPAPFSGSIAGYLIAVEKRGNQDVLVTLDPRTGLTHQLVPQDPNVMSKERSAQTSGNDSLIAPAYSPARHMLAYISIAADGVNSVWVAPLETPANGLPRLNLPDSRRLLANCGPRCKTLTWSPSGKWLILEGDAGLIALDATTGAERAITQNAHDAWPACSPDGSRLVYQHDVEALGYLVVAPADDCIPTPDAAARARLVGAPVVSWRPIWSPDGRMLAYVSATAGKRVYELDALGLFAGATDSDATPFHPISQAGCGDPVWVMEEQTRQNLVLFICSVQSAQRLMVSSMGSQDSEPFDLGASRAGQPALYNPIWIAP